MTNRDEFLQALIGLRWRRGANGPAEYDCWGLAQHVQRCLFGREMPDIKDPPLSVRELVPYVRDHAARSMWREVSCPIDGSLVEMAHQRDPFHIGVWLDIDGGGIIHAKPRAGVCWDKREALIAAGWRKFTYHEWHGSQDPAQ